MAPIYRAHCAVIFAIAQLSCLVLSLAYNCTIYAECSDIIYDQQGINRKRIYGQTLVQTKQ